MLLFLRVVLFSYPVSCQVLLEPASVEDRISGIACDIAADFLNLTLMFALKNSYSLSGINNIKSSLLNWRIVLLVIKLIF